ncbi:putative transferase, protein kinase RLK-Pelle-RLCK-XII-1 family [Dioscorea sansibarensis]
MSNPISLFKSLTTLSIHHSLSFDPQTPQSFPFLSSPPAMGCCVSSPHQLENPNSGNDDQHDALNTDVNTPHNPPSQPPSGGTAPSQPPAGGKAPSQAPAGGTAPFLQYTLAELMAATDGFSRQNIIPEDGDEVPKSVYKGYLHDRQRIAVKKFSKVAWPDAEQFREEAIAVGRLRHRRLVNLIGYCCDGDERLLVAKFMPNDTLATHLFKTKTKALEWSRRLRVACYTAEALEYCSNAGRAVYHDLNSYKVLFDEAGNPCLSCFGLVKNIRDGRSYNTDIAYIPPEYIKGRITSESVIFSFGNVLLDLMSGKQIPPDHALDMIMSNNMRTFLDSRLKGQYSMEEVVALVKLASQCLQYMPKDRPTIKHVIASLEQVQSNVGDAGEPSNATPGTPGQGKTPQILGTQKKDKAPLMLGSPKQDTPQIPQSTSFPIAEAVARVDLTAIHQILLSEGYRGDEASRELAFRDSAQHMIEMLEARRRGELAYMRKDFKTAIECYSQFLDGAKIVSPTTYVRRSLCYLMSDQPYNALSDAMQAQHIQPDWPTAFYMQAIALSQLNRHRDSADKLKEAIALEEKKLTNTIRGTRCSPHC